MSRRRTTEEGYRSIKAGKLAAFIAARGKVIVDQAPSFERIEIEEIARHAGVNAPSEKTWEIVLRRLARMTPEQIERIGRDAVARREQEAGA